MRLPPWSVAVAALAAFGLCLTQAGDEKQDAKKPGETKGKVEAKKDEEAKGKIPEAVRKQILKNKIEYGVVLVGVTAGGPATTGREKPKGEGDIVMLEEGDIITHVDGKEIKSAADYYKLMSGNDEKKLTVIDVNTGKPVTDYFKPEDGKLGIVFEVIQPAVG
jgi:S1-C subfamily serine protease